MADVREAPLAPAPPRLGTEKDRLLALAVVGGVAVVLAAFCAHYLSQLSGLFDASGHPLGRDFMVYWTAAKLAAEGQLLQILDVEGFHRHQLALMGGAFPLHPWPYPPVLLLLIRPLAWLPYLPAYLTWAVLGFALYAYAAHRGGWAGRPALAVVGLLALALAPTSFVNLFVGQNGFFSAALLAGGLFALDRRPVLAGVLFGLLIFKPQLGILIPVALIAMREWRAFAAAAVTGAAFVGLSVAVDGVEIWRLFLTEALPFQTQVTETGSGFFTWMMPTVFMAARLLGLDNAVGYGLQAVSGIAAVGAAYWAFRNTRDPVLRLAVLSVATFLVLPYGFNYDMTIVSVGLVYYALRQADHGFLAGERAVLALAWVLPFAIMPLGAFGLPIGPVVLWLLFACLIRRVRLEAGAPSSPRPI